MKHTGIKNKLFGETLRKHRKARGLTVKEFLKALGSISGKGIELSPAYITRIEVYNEIPKPEVVCKIAETLGIDVKSFLELAKANKIKQLEQSISRKFKTSVN